MTESNDLTILLDDDTRLRINRFDDGSCLIEITSEEGRAGVHLEYNTVDELAAFLSEGPQ